MGRAGAKAVNSRSLSSSIALDVHISTSKPHSETPVSIALEILNQGIADMNLSDIDFRSGIDPLDSLG